MEGSLIGLFLAIIGLLMVIIGFLILGRTRSHYINRLVIIWMILASIIFAIAIILLVSVV